jgi:hypothetical protein
MSANSTRQEMLLTKANLDILIKKPIRKYNALPA